MPHYNQNDTGRQLKTINKLETRIRSLNKSITALPPLCDCLTIEEDAAKQAMAEKIHDLWKKDFQEELRTGVRASIDWMDTSKRKGANGR